MRVLTLILILFSTSVSFAQNFKIHGKVIDSKSGIQLSSVSIHVSESSITVVSDQEGNFTLQLPDGKKYALQVSYIGYNGKTIEDVDRSLEIVIQLDPSMRTETGVEIRSSVKKETTAALITLQKNTAVVAQVISAEAIKRSPDKNTGDVLKRVTGTSIQEGKYLVVRGLSDRYNQAMLNGVLLSSTEPDRKTFSFDIFPASIVENIVINKTFIPELPGEWAGGLIQIQTRDIPAKPFFNLSIGTGFNSNTITKDFMHMPSGKYGWLGLDDGSRSLPSGLPLKARFDALSPADKTAYGKTFANNWQPVEGNASLNRSFQLNGGIIKKILGKKVAGVFGLNYNQQNRIMPFNNIFIANNEGDVELQYNNKKYSRDVLAGALANVTVVLNNNNKLSVKNVLNLNSSDFVIDRYDGRDFILSGGGPGDRIRATETGFKQNTFFNTQITGDHTIKRNTKLKWYGSFNILDQYIPDQRRLFYTQDANDPSAPYYALLGLGAGQKSGSIFYSFLNDYIYTGGIDISRSFRWKDNVQTLKGGYLVQVKDRLFDSRPFFINTASNRLKQLDAGEIFAAENFGTGNDKLQFDEISGNAYRYVANTILNAAYLQLDDLFSQKIRLVWGGRFESYDQVVGSMKEKDPRHVHTLVRDLLPGFNFTYKANSSTNLRLAGSQTIIRPEFRELSPFAFYDFELGAQVVGNKSASRTKVSNADLRWEKYPRSGEMITAGIYIKHFDKPIEYYFNRTGPGTNTFNIVNTEKAIAYGAEFEFRKKLDFVKLFKNITLNGNVSYIYSHVSDSTGTVNRPLQGQSPYVINLGLQYDLKPGFSATLLFNEVGRRILFVGNEAISDIWEAPRPVLDLQLAQKILKQKGELKINVSDIINSRGRFYHDLDGNGKYASGSKDVLAIERNYGTNYTISFSYSFK